jgi:hypothetical protein
MEMTMLGIDKDTLKSGFMTTLAINILRGVINGALKSVSPKDLVQAIRDDTSLWNAAGGDISEQAKSFPISDLSMISDVRTTVEAQYGGFDVVTLKWLAEDHAVLYNIIVNTPDNRGRIWLKKQIDEILDGVQNGG